jgi:hypothetical protein
MTPGAIIGVIIAIAVLGAITWYLITRQRRTEALRDQYGPEYTHAVQEAGSARRAEDELIKRKERVEALEIQPLGAEERAHFTREWRRVQVMFVDDPGGAVSRADTLVEEVMKVRGYPVSDFDQRAADLSVHHARVVENYRAARDIAERHRRRAATTEDLRKAMVYYRELFQDLLEDRENATDRAVDRPVEREVAAREDTRAAGPEPTINERLRRDRDVRP